MFNKCKYQSNLFKIAKEINATDTITKIVAFQPPKNRKIDNFLNIH